MKAKPNTRMRNAITPMAVAHTIKAAELRDRPSARSRKTMGANTAATTHATAIVAETIQKVEVTNRATTTTAAIAIRRQPTAARLISHGGAYCDPPVSTAWFP